MAAKTIDIEFDGYWRDKNKDGIPAESGIYCVYVCNHNKKEKTVTLHKLVYIGEAGDVHDRLDNHEKYKNWKGYLKAGQELCFSFGAVASVDRIRAEAALITKHNPPENTEYVNCFPFDETTISLSGKTSKLNTKFTLQLHKN